MLGWVQLFFKLRETWLVLGMGSLLLYAMGVAAVSIVTPMVSQQIFDKWFAFPNLLLLAPIPLMTAALFFLADYVLRRLQASSAADNQALCWLPFTATVGIFLPAFNGLAYSIFPYLMVDKLTIWQAGSAPESLKIILAGVAVVLPTIIGYTVFSYRVFWGKARKLSYQ